MLSSVFSYILTKLENYSLCKFLINSFEALKNGKTATTKSINISLKKCHTFIGYIEIDAPLAHKGNIEFKILLVKTFSLKKNTKSNTSDYYKKKLVFYSSGKQIMVPLDKGLQWVNVKQKPFGQI